MNRPHQDGRSYALPHKNDVQRICDQLNERLANRLSHPMHMDITRKVDRFVVEGHSFSACHSTGHEPSTLSWGIVPRWGYVNRPDLGQDFHGGFVFIEDAKSYIGERHAA